MIFILKNKDILEKKEENLFKLEKEIQNIVEKNLETLFGYKILSTEFQTGDYRFDTVAFDEETKSFVIIEYKRGKNESLVDQGYAYLYTFLTKSAEFVLLYNEKNPTANKQKKDFNWSETKLIFISPNFTSYQKDAVNLSKVPFKLFEIKKYGNEIFLIEEVNVQNNTIKNTPFNISDEVVQKVSEEIQVYDEEWHLKNADNFDYILYLIKQSYNLGK
ncbi:hypothetical protein J2Z62_000710 [Mycoplasmoides fastidiosum]|uniref:DUF5655 domain-containing protein n=1 Tax=Mycoplasmoides fastidiosum TaxID=92758 RepID=A0ABU0LZZ1_9BACT|nr:hypothetical protein [Mycoplasmoides fastidiosum]MDQ0514272.1 hypothetical protein [Mycoplasmoides fastidiosum]UUD38122.1 hypothetical protein NPA10_01925 [Mycoplasmoides fastidiosum]